MECSTQWFFDMECFQANIIMVQGHSFTNIQGHKEDQFFSKYYYKLPPLQYLELLLPLTDLFNENSPLLVVDLQNPISCFTNWQIWKITHEELGLQNGFNLGRWQEYACQNINTTPQYLRLTPQSILLHFMHYYTVVWTQGAQLGH